MTSYELLSIELRNAVWAALDNNFSSEEVTEIVESAVDDHVSDGREPDPVDRPRKQKKRGTTMGLPKEDPKVLDLGHHYDDEEFV
jgi:hypothetical protein